jgi:hypothetical protein
LRMEDAVIERKRGWNEAVNAKKIGRSGTTAGRDRLQPESFPALNSSTRSSLSATHCYVPGESYTLLPSWKSY